MVKGMEYVNTFYLMLCSILYVLSVREFNMIEPLLWICQADNWHTCIYNTGASYDSLHY